MKIRIIRGNGYELRTTELEHIQKGVAYLLWPEGVGRIVMPFWLHGYARQTPGKLPAEPKVDPRQLGFFHQADLGERQEIPARITGHIAGQGKEEFSDWRINSDDLDELVSLERAKEKSA